MAGRKAAERIMVVLAEGKWLAYASGVRTPGPERIGTCSIGIVLPFTISSCIRDEETNRRAGPAPVSLMPISA